MSPRHVRTFTTGAVASIALVVTGTAVMSSTSAPTQTSRLERSAVTEAGPTTVAPDRSASAGQRGQSVGAGLRDKALRTAVLTDIPPSALAAYQRAASSLAAADPGCHLTWSTLAAIGQVESNHGRSTSRNARGIVGVPLDGKGVKAVADTDAGVLDGDAEHDRAVGPMQILPGTWSTVAVDGDGDGKRDPQDIDDAALAAAVYLCGSGADMSTPAGSQKALRSYNDSASYVALVQSVARSYAKDEKASYSIGSLQTGGIDYSAVGMGNPGNLGGTDVTPAKKAKQAAAESKTPAATRAPSATPTKAPTSPLPPAKGGPKPTTPTSPPAPTTPTNPAPAPQQVAVPDVVGQQVTDALMKLRQAGLVDGVRTEVYDAAAAGQVLAQDKTGQAAKGAAVALTVSSGPVRNVIGQTYAQAVLLLQGQGFTVAVDSSGAAENDDATVTAQTPDATSTRVTKSSTVTLTLQAPAATGTGH